MLYQATGKISVWHEGVVLDPKEATQKLNDNYTLSEQTRWSNLDCLTDEGYEFSNVWDSVTGHWLVDLPDDFLEGFEDGRFDGDECASVVDQFGLCLNTFDVHDTRRDNWQIDFSGLKFSPAGEDCVLKQNGLSTPMFVINDGAIVPNIVVEEIVSMSDDSQDSSEISAVVSKLQELNKKSHATQLEAFELFSRVKGDKSYKVGFGDWGKFVKATTFSRAYADYGVRIWNNELLREVFVEIGFGKAMLILKLADNDNEISQLVEVAKTGTGEDVKAAGKAMEEQGDTEQEEPEVSLLEQQAKLMAEKNQLEARLSEILVEMQVIDEQVRGMSK